MIHAAASVAWYAADKEKRENTVHERERRKWVQTVKQVIWLGGRHGHYRIWPDRIWPKMVFHCFDRIWPEFWCFVHVWSNVFLHLVGCVPLFLGRLQHFLGRAFDIFWAC